MKLLVVIVSYRVTDLTIECLRSLAGKSSAFRRKGCVMRERNRWRCGRSTATGHQGEQLGLLG